LAGSEAILSLVATSIAIAKRLAPRSLCSTKACVSIAKTATPLMGPPLVIVGSPLLAKEMGTLESLKSANLSHVASLTMSPSPLGLQAQWFTRIL